MGPLKKSSALRAALRMNGSGTRIRTLISGTRIRGPAIRRSPTEASTLALDEVDVHPSADQADIDACPPASVGGVLHMHGLYARQ